MVNKLFQYDNMRNRVELCTEELLLIKEFSDLMKPERNKCDEDSSGVMGLRAFREFTYIWLALAWDSIYADYSEHERHESALKDASLTEEEFNNPEFRAACRKYREIQDLNRSIKLLLSARETVDKFIDYFQNVDPLERDVQTGKPIFKVKDIQAELKGLVDVHETLVNLEAQVKKQLESQSVYRGGAVEDFDPGNF